MRKRGVRQRGVPPTAAGPMAAALVAGPGLPARLAGAPAVELEPCTFTGRADAPVVAHADAVPPELLDIDAALPRVTTPLELQKMPLGISQNFEISKTWHSRSGKESSLG